MRCPQLLVAGLLLLWLTLSLQLSAVGAQSGDSQVAAIVPRQPVYNANFSTQPTGSIWTWASADPGDSTTLQAVHQGVAILDGSATGWIDLNSSSTQGSGAGPVPLWGGGSSFYPLGDPLSGWSLEIVVKFPVVSQGWAKLLELSDGTGGGSGNNLALTWYNGGDQGDDSGYKMAVEQYINANSNPQAQHGEIEMLVPVANQWYHIVLGFQPLLNATAGFANWFFYVNGQPLAYAAALLPGSNATLVQLQGANMPLLVPRPVSTIGKSAWGDPDVQATVDAFRMYDYLLPAATVSALASAYQLNIPQPVQQSFAFPVTAETSAAHAVVPRVPIFEAPFSQDPTVADAANVPYSNYQWMASDPTDSAQLQALHQGIIALNGSASSFVNLGVASGPQSVGEVMPLIGLPGSGAVGVDQGLSVEMVVKFPYIASSDWRQKLLDLGSGAACDSFDFGLDGTNNGPFQLFMENQNNLAAYAKQPPLYNYAGVAFYPALVPGVWYHLVWVLSQPNFVNWTASWQAFVNGQPASQLVSNGAWPLPVSRPFAWLGGSNWDDSNLPALYDVVRVYDYALQPAAISALSALYNAVPPASCASPVASGGGDAAVLSLVPRLPVYNANFSTNPNCSTGVASTYTWALQDPSDTGAAASAHTGVAILTGSSASWVDLTQAYGPQTSGAGVMPVWGGQGAYPAGNPLQGWSMEVVVKFPTIGQGWSKIVELSDGTGGGNNNNLCLTFTNSGDAGDDSGVKLSVEQYSSAALTTATHGVIEFLSVQPAQWYHIVAGFQPSSLVPGAATWYIYVNGQPMSFASYWQPNATLSAVQGANMPLLVPRPVSTIGKSAWGDPYLQATVDAFRMYDYLLPAATVAALAGAYGLNIPQPVQQSFAFPVTAETSNALQAVPTPPIFNLAFAQNPAVADAANIPSTNYQWLQQDPTDTAAVAALHQGIVALSGSPTSYIDLSTAYGPQSVGAVLPIIGLPGSGSAGAGTQGLSVELVFKLPTAQPQGGSKLFDLATGSSCDSFDLGLSSSGAELQMEDQNNLAPFVRAAGSSSYASALSFPTLTNNTWYHAVWVLSQPSFQYWNASWSLYVNGALQAPSPYAGIWPLPTSRPFSFLAGSNWGNPNTIVSFDTFRIYDYSLQQPSIAALATIALNGPPPGSSSSSSGPQAPTGPASSASSVSLPPPSSSTATPPAPTAASSSSATALPAPSSASAPTGPPTAAPSSASSAVIVPTSAPVVGSTGKMVAAGAVQRASGLPPLLLLGLLLATCALLCL